MVIINTNTVSSPLDHKSKGSFQTGILEEGSKTTNFLEQLYSYPPKLKIK